MNTPRKLSEDEIKRRVKDAYDYLINKLVKDPINFLRFEFNNALSADIYIGETNYHTAYATKGKEIAPDMYQPIIVIDPEFVASHEVKEIAFAIAHEMSHIALDNFDANVASDLVINTFLEDIVGLDPGSLKDKLITPEAIERATFSYITTMEIRDLVKDYGGLDGAHYVIKDLLKRFEKVCKERSDLPLCRESTEQSGLQPSKLPAPFDSPISQQSIGSRIIEGKNTECSEEICKESKEKDSWEIIGYGSKTFEEYLHKISWTPWWRTLKEKLVSEGSGIMPEGTTYRRMNRRYVYLWVKYGIYYPGYESEEPIMRLYAIVDSSIDKYTLKYFFTALEEAMRGLNLEKIDLIAFADKAKHFEIKSYDDFLKLRNQLPTGGTVPESAFKILIDLLAKNNEPSAVVFLSDGLWEETEELASYIAHVNYNGNVVLRFYVYTVNEHPYFLTDAWERIRANPVETKFYLLPTLIADVQKFCGC
ncbi:hypothetical protein DFR86_11680 [Acidianus sulfidivorans JP7]|uniref:VWA domain-containing protein n=1 Tax=Acidianus sulfidivorans JP7 TaxID=619593 RepID=A0A2U9IQ27_9CREN|nr:hypothetical protein [Acidianus sulfidivorans]AWR98130.1 hypothetical protein DFR86_11680 [Acidianus sulfidivorans JP7]